MAPSAIHVLGIDPGITTGWCLITVPRACIFGNEESKVLEWDYGEVTGSEPEQVVKLARLMREIQSLDYKVGPAVIVEDFTIQPHMVSTDPEVLAPVRIAAMIFYAAHRGECGDSRIILQNRQIAKETMNDDRLRRSGYWVEGSDHIRDATKHAITALRRASAASPSGRAFRAEMWNEKILVL